jgi:hypothetical protein
MQAIPPTAQGAAIPLAVPPVTAPPLVSVPAQAPGGSRFRVADNAASTTALPPAQVHTSPQHGPLLLLRQDLLISHVAIYYYYDRTC